MLAQTVQTRFPLEAEAPSRCFAQVEVHRDATAIADLWRTFEKATPCSIYQTRAWLLPWIETLGRKAGIDPLFIVARAANGRPVFLACLGITRIGPMRIAEWLGGSDANVNLPMLDREIEWTPSELQRLFRSAAAACGREAPHVFNLVNQPLLWAGRANPLSVLPRWPTPSPAFGGDLPPDAETFFATRLSKDTRKKLRKKEQKLAALGTLHHVVARDTAMQRRIIDTFLAQKVERFRAQKIRSQFDTPEMKDFIERASAPRGHGIELHALVVGDAADRGRIVAIYGGAAHGGQWSGMFNAFDTDTEIAKSSPGDLLLMRIIAKACSDGLTRFDLGIGAARYKTTFCADQIDLFGTAIATGVIGTIGAKALAWRQAAKRAIKANPRLFAFSRRIVALRG